MALIKPTVTALFYGQSGDGKSTAAATTPPRRLVVDSEGGAHHSNKRATLWKPLEGPPPQDDGTWDACIVQAVDWRNVEAALLWLEHSHEHPFRSVVLDSLTEAQGNLITAVSGVDKTERDGWGEVLRRADDFVRRVRNISNNQDSPIEALVVVCLESTATDGRKVPMLRGQLKDKIGAYFDVVCHMKARQELDANGAPLIRYGGEIASTTALAKDRTGLLAAHAVGGYLDHVNVTEWLSFVSASLNPNTGGN